MWRLLNGAVELSGFIICPGHTAKSGLVFFEDYICEWQSDNRQQEWRLEHFQGVAVVVDCMIISISNKLVRFYQVIT